MVFVTLFPNFNMPLIDPYLASALKVQIDFTGAPQISSSYVATLHHQMVYRVPNHDFDIAIPKYVFMPSMFSS